MIQRLAVKKELFDRTYPLIFNMMARGSEELQEMCIVWRDWRTVREGWGLKGLVFREVRERELLGSGRDNEYMEFMLRRWRKTFGDGVKSEGGHLQGERKRKGVRIRMGVVEEVST
ncbi:hypothetical protein ONS95_011102 [Cadophora gregata]|uniref:uncharacterized protein n=1 Tax=Cadophora gregata TaxID=51156 RepID=UPI0026DCBE79|nr:uncharacterized protein ONS95_011102 [Cadophora gregata]KAK0119665.1 hypothetical protein ONS95_011102 [Cadophora gregata]